MDVLSGRTEVVIIDALDDLCSHAELSLVFRTLELAELDRGGSKVQRISCVIDAIKREFPQDADRRIIQIAGEAFSRSWSSPSNHSYLLERTTKLRDTLRVEGWDFVEGRLMPTTPEPADLAREVSTLERQLKAHGLEVALRHYQQSVDNFAAGGDEATGGQIRSFLENLFAELCKREGNKELSGTSALQHLYNKGKIDKGEYDLSRALFDSTQSRGAHAGLSQQEEGRFRLHFATALARYLLWRFALRAEEVIPSEISTDEIPF